jgi:hypothetical protein
VPVAEFRVPSSPEPKLIKDIKPNDYYKSQIEKRHGEYAVQWRTKADGIFVAPLLHKTLCCMLAQVTCSKAFSSCQCLFQSLADSHVVRRNSQALF